jgi:hypothetical protein
MFNKKENSPMTLTLEDRNDTKNQHRTPYWILCSD